MKRDNSYIELKNLLLSNKVKIYDTAFELSRGDQETALKRIFYAVCEVAKSFRNFANKENALSYLLVMLEYKDIPYKKIILHSNDVEELIILTLDQYQRKKKKRNIICVTALLSAVLLIGLSFGISRFGTEPPPPIVDNEPDGVVMNNTTVITGDVTDSELRNYHNLTSELGAKAKFDVFVDRMKFVDYFSTAITAPDGNTYVAYQNFEEENGNNTTFTLYKATEDGWNAIGKGDISSVFINDAYGGEYTPSCIHVIADSLSNIYVFCMLDENIVVYKFDTETNIFEKSALDIPFEAGLGNKFLIYYDKTYGTNGTVYIACLNSGLVTLYSYDVLTNSAELYAKAFNVGKGVNNTDMVLTAKDDVVYMVTQNGLSGWVLNYYAVHRNQEPVKTELFRSNSFVSSEVECIANKNLGSGGIAVDRNGLVHVITTYKASGISTERSLKHYVIDSSGDVIQKCDLPILKFEDGGYLAECAGVFVGKDSNLYYIEIYKGLNNYFSIGMLNETDHTQSIYIDSFELPNNIDLGRIRQNNFDFLFYGEEEKIFYFSLYIDID